MKNSDRAAAVKVLSAIRISVPVIKMGGKGEKNIKMHNPVLMYCKKNTKDVDIR